MILAKPAEGPDRADIDRGSAGRIVPTQEQDSGAGESLEAGIHSLLDVANTVEELCPKIQNLE